ncbi:MAG: Asd/ArgC dimerization domain-containing protein [Acidobacteriota bacterium]
MAHETGAGARIAFFGPLTLLAREIRTALEGRAFPIADVKLFDEGAEGTLGEFAGEAVVVTRPEENAGIDIAFMCGSARETVPYLDWPSRDGFVAIDLSGAARERAQIPIVHAEINPGDIVRGANGKSGGCPAQVIAAPHAVSHNLSTIGASAARAGRLQRIEAVSLRPASDLGQEAVDELYRQTLGLLNFSDVPKEVFGRQLAFNVVPSTSVSRSRAEGFDERVREETRRILGLAPGSVCLASSFVPVFHGHALFVTLTFREKVDHDALKNVMGAMRGLRVVEDGDDFSPVDLAGTEDIAVMDLAPDGKHPERATLWCFCDNLKGGAALNAVRIAERVTDIARKAKG